MFPPAIGTVVDRVGTKPPTRRTTRPRRRRIAKLRSA
jgi:hypothetical protein